MAPAAPAPDAELAAIYDRFAARLYAVAVRLLGGREEAEECVQDLFVALARSRAARVRIDDLGAYLFSSLRHLAAARARAQGRRERLVSVLERSDSSPAPGPDSLEARALANALRALPEEQRAVIALKIDGQLTFAEIAAALDIRANTAASRYRYALEKLRALLAGEGP